MLLLQNGNQINQDALIQALDGKFDFACYLDVQTGRIGRLEALGCSIADKSRHFLIPQVEDSTKLKWVPDFIEVMVPEYDPALADSLRFALKCPRPFFKFKGLIDAAGSEWIDSWEMWKGDPLDEEMWGWLETLPVDVEEKWEWFDDCPCCQMMKEAEEQGRAPTIQETKQAFRKASEQNPFANSLFD